MRQVNSPQPWYEIPKSNIPEKSVVIVGGGLAGTSLAFSFAKRKWQVTLIERSDALANGASGNKVGIITPVVSHKNDVIGDFFLSGFNHTINHIKNLKVAWQQCGAIDISESKVSKKLEESSVSSLNINKITASETFSLCGADIKNDAIHIAECGFLNPAELCRANIEAGESYIKTIFNKNALSIERQNSKWHIKGDSGEDIAAAGAVVVANANDAIGFEQLKWLPLTPVAGQVSYLKNSGLNLKTIVCYEGGYVTPSSDGVVCVGATFRRGSEDTNVTDADHTENLNNLRKNIDIERSGEVSGRTAIRSTTPDRRPVIGQLPNFEAFNADYADLKHGRQKQYLKGDYLSGLYVSTGHGSRGLTSCPLAAEIIAAMACNESLPIDKKILDSLNPARFIIRGLKRG